MDILIDTKLYCRFLESCGLRQNTYRSGHRVYEGKYLDRPVVVNDRVPFVPDIIYREHMKYMNMEYLRMIYVTEDNLLDWIEKNRHKL